MISFQFHCIVNFTSAGNLRFCLDFQYYDQDLFFLLYDIPNLVEPAPC